jgi:hypothetical protein
VDLVDLWISRICGSVDLADVVDLLDLVDLWIS